MSAHTSAGLTDQHTRDLAEMQRLREQVAELTDDRDRLQRDNDALRAIPQQRPAAMRRRPPVSGWGQ